MCIKSITGHRPVTGALIALVFTLVGGGPLLAQEECTIATTAVGGGSVSVQAPGGGFDPELAIEIAGDLSYVRLENSELLIEYRAFFNNHAQFAIKDLVIKEVGEDQISASDFDYIGAGAGIGDLDSATITYDGFDKKTVRMVWNRWIVSTQTMNPSQKIIRDITIFPHSRFIQTDFVDIKYAINLADLGRPGGISNGLHVSHGSDDWARGLITHDEPPGVFYSRYSPDGVNDPVDGGPLAYNGHFVTAVYNPANGVGFGRVIPVAHTHVIKLLLHPGARRGLEFQNYPFLQAHPPFTGWVYVFTDGETEALQAGYDLVDQAGGSGGSFVCGDDVEVAALPYTNWGFTGWSGAASGTVTPTSVTVSDPVTQATGSFVMAPGFLNEDFESYTAGQNPSNWVDTAASGSLTVDDSLFAIETDADGDYFATNSTATNIHSHVDGVAFEDGYVYTGRMRITDSQGGIGVTFFSQYPSDMSYYRLRRYFSNDFHLTASGTSFTSGTTETGVVPTTGEWYRFTIRVEDTGTQTDVRARVWRDGSPEPEDWQVEAIDASGTRLTGGTVGVWTFTSGAKHFDEFVVRTLTPPLDMDLDINVVGNGTIVRDPDQAAYAFGESVSVEAIPDPMWRFVEWTGDITSELNPLPLAMSTDLNLTATFEELTVHTVTPSIVGQGVINITPDLPFYEFGDSVTIHAVPEGGWTFGGWGGTLAGAPNPVTLVMTEDVTAVANFTQLVATYTESFDGYSTGDDPDDWVDTAANNSLAVTDLFDVRGVDPYLGTNSTGTNIHSHFTNLSTSGPGYQFTGRMRISAADGGVGVTFFSQFTDSAAYYRLRRFGTNDFHLTSVGGTPLQGQFSTGVTPSPGVWYRFRLEVDAETDRTAIRARVWTDGDAEPTVWQAEAFDESAGRFTDGTIGVWSYLSGEKCWDDFEVLPLVPAGPPPTFSLTSGVSGNGMLDVSPDQALYDAGTVVDLTATPDVGWFFVEWQGDVTGSENPTTITMTADSNVTAVFAEIVQYSVATTVVGQGTVTVDPDVTMAETGTSLTFTATPDPGWLFAGWQGSLGGAASPETLIVTEDVLVTAIFTEITQHPIDVTIVGPGTVTRNPDLALYDLNDTVTLTATPDVGFIFSGWTGDITTNDNPLDVLVDGDLALTATFVEQPIGYMEDFESYPVGGNAANWLDTDSGNSLLTNDSLFSVFQTGTNEYLGTSSTATNIHSHLNGLLLPQGGYEVSGRMRITNAQGGIGITAFSDYPNSNRYYRLRRYFSNSFHLTANGTSITSGTVDTGVVPGSNQWYLFRIQVEDTGTQTEIRAKVWLENTAQPANWQAECADSSATRLTDGTIGVWSFHTGAKCWDDFVVDPLGPPTPPATDLMLDVTVNGMGSVVVDPDLAEYTEGDLVDLTALPAAGYVFTGWTGDFPSQMNPLTITMLADQSVTANFVEEGTGYFENFESYLPGEDATGWLDTRENNSLLAGDDYFVANVAGSNAMHTASNATNIHSHYTGVLPSGAYEYSGRMRASSSGGGIGVTFFSDFPNTVRYYRLRRFFTNSFHMTANGTSLVGDVESNVVPQAGQWYRFRIQVRDEGARTTILARVWLDGTAEPTDWSIDCADTSATRLIDGKVGIWSFYNGTKSWDDLTVTPL